MGREGIVNTEIEIYAEFKCIADALLCLMREMNLLFCELYFLRETAAVVVFSSFCVL